jgi:membrane-associated phospholipid phosphatase
MDEGILNPENQEHQNPVEILPETIQKSSGLPWLLISTGFIFSGFCLWLFAELADDFSEPQIKAFDKTVIDWFHSFNYPHVSQFMFWVTQTGSGIWITTFSLVTVYWLWFYKKDALSILFFIITVSGGAILNYYLKLVFQRLRPSLDATIGAVGFSFPSGHAMGSMIFYGFIGYLVISSERKRSSKIITSIVLFLFIVLIGISRIYLNAHFPSDVIAGFCAGLLWLILTITALRTIKWQRRVNSPSHPKSLLNLNQADIKRPD